MENNFYRDQFEQMLKDTADSFRMYPTRKLWHSIYNDLHPAKKWPSLTILFILVSSIMYIGVTNPETATPTASSAQVNNDASANSISYASVNGSSNAFIEADKKTGAFRSKSMATKGFTSKASLNNNTPVISERKYNSTSIQAVSIEVASAESIQEDLHQELNQIQPAGVISTPEISFPEITDIEPVSAEGPESKVPVIAVATNTDELEKMEDFAFYNLSNKNSKDRWAYQLYATPSVGFRNLQKTEYVNESNRSALIAPQAEEEYFINHTSAMNVEAGGSVIYNASEKWRFKAGIQFNYTNYYISAYEMNHPVASSLLLNDENTGLPAVVAKSSMLSNSQSLANTHLNNNTYQVSVPVGADFLIAGNKAIKWYAGATIQPTYISGGNAYLISTDMKNYISDPSLMRKFNINGGMETFISYHLKTGMSLNMGPQVRYQLLSTYSNNYNYSEKLFNLGIKVGITSRF